MAAAAQRSDSALRHAALGAAGFVVILAAWEGLRLSGLVSERLFAFPSTIAAFLLSGRPIEGLGQAAVVSARQFAIALGIAGSLGVFTGLLLGWYRRFGEILEPLIVAAYSVPLIAVIPLLVVLMGIDQKTIVTVVATFIYFPIFFAVSAAVAGASRQLIVMCRAFGGSDWDIMRTIVLPSTLPALIAGMRVGIARGFMGLVAAEFFMGRGGLGSMVFDSVNQGRPVPAMLAVAVFCAANLALTLLLELGYRRLARWQPA